MDRYKILIIYLLVINVVAFLIFGWDKLQARKNRWRISERTLFLSALLGGGLGGIAGMKVWHHKTRKWYFKFGIPLIVVLQMGAVLYMGLNGGNYSF